MNRQFVWWLCLGLLGILVVSVSGPALQGAVSVIEDQAIEPPELDDGDDQLVEDYFGEQPESSEGGLPVEWLLVGATILALVIAIRIGLRNATKRTVLVALGITGIAAVFGWLALSGSAPETASTAGIPDSVSLVIGVLLLMFAIGGAVVILARSSTGTSSLDAMADPIKDQRGQMTADTSSVAEFPKAINRPADNDIYRTWQALAESVGKGTDDAATPGDVQSAAIEHGFDTEAVDELRRLFEDSRYGDRTPTREREQRAIELLRDLESKEANSNE